MTTQSATPAAAEAEAEATRTTSPVVGLKWTGTATLAEASAGIRKIGYVARFRAENLIVTRANGSTEERPEIMLRANHEADIIAAEVAKLKAESGL